MPDHLDLQRIAARSGLGPEDRADGGNRDEHQDQRGNDRPRDLERRVAVYMLWLTRGAGAPAETNERVDENRFDDDENNRAEPDQDFEEKSDVAIGVRPGMKDRVRVLSAGGNDEREGRQRYRQRGTSEPARAELMMHCAFLFFRRAVRRWRRGVMSRVHGTQGREQGQGTGCLWLNQAAHFMHTARR